MGQAFHCIYKCFESKFMKLNILKYLAYFVRKLSSLNSSCVWLLTHGVVYTVFLSTTNLLIAISQQICNKWFNVLLGDELQAIWLTIICNKLQLLKSGHSLNFIYKYYNKTLTAPLYCTCMFLFNLYLHWFHSPSCHIKHLLHCEGYYKYY